MTLEDKGRIATTELSARNIATKYFLQYINGTLVTDPDKWITDFSLIQAQMRSVGTPVDDERLFYKLFHSTGFLTATKEEWKHELAHRQFSLDRRVPAQIYVSRFPTRRNPNEMHPWVNLDALALQRVPDLRQFLGGFLDAPDKVSLSYNLEQAVADFLLGRKYPKHLEEFITLSINEVT